MTHTPRGAGTLAKALICCIACCMVSCIGCSGGDGGTDQGNAAEAALARHECYLGLQVPGVTHSGFACSGTGTSSSVSAFRTNTFELALGVSMSFAEAPAVGELSLTGMTVEVHEGEVTQRWDAPVEACSAMATDSSVDQDFGWTYFSIDVSCSEPALPQDTNPGDPIELGDFSIVTFFTLD